MNHLDDVWVPPLTPIVQDVLKEARLIASKKKDKFVRLQHLEIALYNQLQKERRGPTGRMCRVWRAK